MSKNLIIKNTIILYVQIILTAIFSLLSVRYILDNLGEVDYGVFSVIAGVLGFLIIINNALNASTQRYLSFELGRNNLEKVKAYFNSSLGIYLILSIFIVLLGLLSENVIINDLLVIPESRLKVAHVVYKLVMCNLILTFLGVPFHAILNAREKMSVSAIIEIIKAIGVLLISISLYYINIDKLLFYSMLFTTLTFALFILLIVITYKLYEECRYDRFYIFNKKLIKEQLSFSSWNLFGGVSSIAPNQGTNVLLNIFFGPVVNSAFTVSNQISARLSIFSATIMKASRPQIIKAEAAGDRKRLHQISFSSSKYAFFILYLIALPVLLELDFILDVWLVDVPKYAVKFCELIIITALINQITVSLISVMLAVGRIALYQTVVGSILISLLPIGYLLFYNGYGPNAILYTGICIAIVAGTARVVFIKIYAKMSIQSWIKEVPLKSFISVLPGSIIVLFIFQFFNESWLRLIIVCVTGIIINGIFIYLLGMNDNEKKIFKNIIKTKIIKK